MQLTSQEVERLRSLDLPGLTALDAENETVRIRTTDADGTMRALYASGIEIRDVTVEASHLDDVSLKLAQSEEEPCLFLAYVASKRSEPCGIPSLRPRVDRPDSAVPDRRSRWSAADQIGGVSASV